MFYHIFKKNISGFQEYSRHILYLFMQGLIDLIISYKKTLFIYKN